MITKKNNNQKAHKQSNKNYKKKIETMYRRGCSIDYICNVTKESPISVICVMQRIFAMDHM